MGPRTLVRGNMTLLQTAPQAAVLQWGRALSCAEIVRRRDHLCQHGPASMGPRTLVRGNLAGVTVTEFLSPLQWGRALSCAEMVIVRTPRGTSLSFNGAAHSRARKYPNA